VGRAMAKEEKENNMISVERNLFIESQWKQLVMVQNDISIYLLYISNDP
jgi:hypothetical protein